uniref:CoA_binding domain-containing protein n=1 Tax=Macrostomum lignano TaxID=282301 RepID=A0A1I8FET4_9PLAT
TSGVDGFVRRLRWRSAKRRYSIRAQSASFWGMQQRSVQNCLDFDFVCSRREPSVVAIVYPFVGNHNQKYYWGHNEILIPVYKQMSDAMRKHPDASVMVNFASLRSAYDSVAVPADSRHRHHSRGIPENLSRRLALRAAEKSVTVIGPATVGGIKPGCFKIGNTGGMMDNILNSKLPGSVAYVSAAAACPMSSTISSLLNADGVLEGVAIGGDRYPGFHFSRPPAALSGRPGAQMLVVLGEVGGQEEWRIADALRDGRITKQWWPGASAPARGCWALRFNSVTLAPAPTPARRRPRPRMPLWPPRRSRARQLRSVGRDNSIWSAAASLCRRRSPAPPTVPMDYSWARELGLIRKPSSFMTSICDERGQELLYAGCQSPRSSNRDFGIGASCLCCGFNGACLTDHGPAVSGAHNTIVCARAGKDLVSCLTSGLLTIGDRFGGALDGAAKQFSHGVDTGLIPMEFVNENAQARRTDHGHWASADEFIEIGALNGMFVLGRSMGFIGHYLDQRRLKQGLYRHPWDDISYVMPEQSQWAPLVNC